MGKIVSSRSASGVPPQSSPGHAEPRGSRRYCEQFESCPLGGCRPPTETACLSCFRFLASAIPATPRDHIVEIWRLKEWNRGAGAEAVDDAAAVLACRIGDAELTILPIPDSEEPFFLPRGRLRLPSPRTLAGAPRCLTRGTIRPRPPWRRSLHRPACRRFR